MAEECKDEDFTICVTGHPERRVTVSDYRIRSLSAVAALKETNAVYVKECHTLDVIESLSRWMSTGRHTSTTLESLTALWKLADALRIDVFVNILSF